MTYQTNYQVPTATLRLREGVANVFDREALIGVCEMAAAEFEGAYDMQRVDVQQAAPHDFYLFKDNGARVLFVAHLDTVEGGVGGCSASVVDTADGPVAFSGALDDRLGAYVGLELLPALGCEFDYLLTVGEEHGLSTAAFFDSDEHDAAYNWVIEFDRGGTDVVLYQYEDDETVRLVEDTGARVSTGAFSDISFLEHLQIKAFNWGVGYRDYHGPRAHAWLNDTFKMVAYFLTFYTQHRDTHLPHRSAPKDNWLASRGGGSLGWDDYGYSGGYTTGEYVVEDCLEFTDDELNCSGAVTEHEFGLLCDGHHTLYFG